jgi:hypothetical protein
VGGRLGACEPSRLVRLTLLAALALGCVLAGCAGTPGRPASGGADGTWAGRPIGVRPVPRPALNAAIIGLAEQEWHYFGRQTVVYRGPEESIPHVGLWEDEDAAHSQRVNHSTGVPWAGPISTVGTVGNPVPPPSLAG